jgi:hypothetical protein
MSKKGGSVNNITSSRDAVIAAGADRSLALLDTLHADGLSEAELIGVLYAALSLTISCVSAEKRDAVADRLCGLFQKNDRSPPASQPLTDAEADPRHARLANVADRHLEKLGRLPFSDRLTVATTILGSIVMEIDEGQQLEVLDDQFAGLRAHLTTGGMG